MKRRAAASQGIERDPFHELGRHELRWRAHVLGAPFEFSSNDAELLDLARHAFGGSPRHRWTTTMRAPLRVSLERLRAKISSPWRTPPQPMLSSGAGLLFGHVDARNFVVVDTRAGGALIQVTDAMLRHPDLLRYELIEFAAITLATRAQGLVSLHAGCVGARGRGILLLGSSGAGKSTLALHAALGGLDYLAEDSVFVQPASLRATALSAFVHAREDALKLFADPRLRRVLGKAPRIRRRSGVRKLEIDLRLGAARVAPAPLRIVATVVLCARRARGAASLQPLSAPELKQVLRDEQGFAITQPGWREFEQRILRADRFRLERMPPAEAVAALRRLLAQVSA